MAQKPSDWNWQGRPNGGCAALVNSYSAESIPSRAFSDAGGARIANRMISGISPPHPNLES